MLFELTIARHHGIVLDQINFSPLLSFALRSRLLTSEGMIIFGLGKGWLFCANKMTSWAVRKQKGIKS
jgi:hypothetical protein